jgi:hypothetical protein
LACHACNLTLAELDTADAAREREREIAQVIADGGDLDDDDDMEI